VEKKGLLRMVKKGLGIPCIAEWEGDKSVATCGESELVVHPTLLARLHRDTDMPIWIHRYGDTATLKNKDTLI
jgi:hypothetical protein